MRISKWVLNFFVLSCLIMSVLYFLNNTFGNPAWENASKLKIEDYLKSKYPSKDYYIAEDKVRYHSKFGSYFAMIKARNDMEVEFTISARPGGIVYDYYDEKIK